MYKLEYLNIVSVVDSEAKRDILLEQGYKLIEDKAENADRFAEMSVEELKAFAGEREIDLGNATSAKGIAAKIRKALESDGNA